MTAVVISIFAFLLVVLTVLAVLLRRTRHRLHRSMAAFTSASARLESLQMAFQQFVPQSVVEDIISCGVSVRGERRTVTVLFADVVGFTAIAERLEPERVVQVLNGYFETVSRAVSRHNGRIAKLIGDGVMVIFGAPEGNPWQVADAARAALAIRVAMASYNEALEADGLERLPVVIGVHTGPVVAGVVGSDRVVEYTVIGDVVNTASRIEALTRRLGEDVLVSSDVQQQLDGRFTLRAMESIDVKGKSGPLRTYALDAYREE